MARVIATQNATPVWKRNESLDLNISDSLFLAFAMAFISSPVLLSIVVL